MIGVQALIVLLGVMACLYFIPEVMSGQYQCDKDNRLTDLLAGALAAALAFAGGFTRSPPKE